MTLRTPTTVSTAPPGAAAGVAASGGSRSAASGSGEERGSIAARADALAMGLVRRVIAARGRDATEEFSGRSTLVIAPHPDDETLGCGATIMRKLAAGSEVHVVVVTDGRRSHQSEQISPDELARRREGEARGACAELGVAPDHLHFLRCEDHRVAERTGAVRDGLAAIIEWTSPGDILSPSGIDRNADHRAISAIVGSLLAGGAIRCPVYEYPVWMWSVRSWTTPGAAAVRQAAEAVVRPVIGAARMRALLVRTDGLLERKWAALEAHRSQLENLTGEATWTTIQESFLSHFFGPHECFFEVRGGGRRRGSGRG